MLYVGKAKNLKKRISSYTRITSSSPKTFKLINSSSSLKFQTLNSELEAIIFEASLIKSHQPPYNINLKDDKTPLYLVITSDAFPLIKTARKKQLSTEFHQIPRKNIFGPFSSSKQAKSVLITVRTIFKFCDSPNNSAGKPCFYTHLHLCSGACTGTMSSSDYSKLIHQVKIFLRGKKQILFRTLKNDMHYFSKQHQFEQAALARDRWVDLEKFYSISKFSPDLLKLPILSEDIVQERLIQTASYLHQKGIIPEKFPLNRIEAYDISNTNGLHSTASMVCFINGQSSPSNYRRFKIRYTSQGGDPAMIAEVISRRLNHPEWPYPQLIIIDGGKAQLKKAHQLTSPKIPTVSIVKNPDRLLIYQNQEYKYFRLIPGTLISQLIQQLRDESHRFARSYHFKLRQSSLYT